MKRTFFLIALLLPVYIFSMEKEPDFIFFNNSQHAVNVRYHSTVFGFNGEQLDVKPSEEIKISRLVSSVIVLKINGFERRPFLLKGIPVKVTMSTKNNDTLRIRQTSTTIEEIKMEKTASDSYDKKK